MINMVTVLLGYIDLCIHFSTQILPILYIVYSYTNNGDEYISIFDNIIF